METIKYAYELHIYNLSYVSFNLIYNLRYLDKYLSHKLFSFPTYWKNSIFPKINLCVKGLSEFCYLAEKHFRIFCTLCSIERLISCYSGAFEDIFAQGVENLISKISKSSNSRGRPRGAC
jgi:hypothetical protein